MLSVGGVFLSLGYRMRIECPTETKFNFKFLKCEVEYHKTGGVRIRLPADGLVSIDGREKDGKSPLFNGVKEGFYSLEVKIDGALKRERKVFVESGKLLENNFQTFFRDSIKEKKKSFDVKSEIVFSQVIKADFLTEDLFFVSTEDSIAVFNKSGEDIFTNNFRNPFRVFHNENSLLILELRKDISDCQFYSLSPDNSGKIKMSKIGESDYSQGYCSTVFYDAGVNNRKINISLGHETFVANLENNYIRRPLTEDKFEIEIDNPETINQLSNVALYDKKMSISDNSLSFLDNESFVNVSSDLFSVSVRDGYSDKIIFRSGNQILDIVLDYNYEFAIILTNSGDIFAASIDGEEVYKFSVEENSQLCTKLFVLKDNEELGCIIGDNEEEAGFILYDIFFNPDSKGFFSI